MIWRDCCDLSHAEVNRYGGVQNFLYFGSHIIMGKITLSNIGLFSFLTKSFNKNLHDFLVLILLPGACIIGEVNDHPEEESFVVFLWTIWIIFSVHSMSYILQRSLVPWCVNFHRLVSFVVTPWSATNIGTSTVFIVSGRDVNIVDGNYLFWTLFTNDLVLKLVCSFCSWSDWLH